MARSTDVDGGHRAALGDVDDVLGADAGVEPEVRAVEERAQRRAALPDVDLAGALRKLGDRGFFTWDGNYYALNLTEQLDVERSGGFLRIGLVHYNTMQEVESLLAALRDIVQV